MCVCVCEDAILLMMPFSLMAHSLGSFLAGDTEGGVGVTNNNVTRLVYHSVCLSFGVRRCVVKIAMSPLVARG